MKVEYFWYGLGLDPETEKEEQDLKFLQKQINDFLTLYTIPSRYTFEIGIEDPEIHPNYKYDYIFYASAWEEEV